MTTLRFFRNFFCGVLTLLCLTTIVNAHGGRTDSSGGHNDMSNGGYHYHHGYSAHDHYDIDGDGDDDCPYTFDNNADNNSNSVTFDDILEAMQTQFFRAVVYSLIGSTVFTYICGSIVACDEKRERLIAWILVAVLFVVLYILLIYEQVMYK